MIKNGEYLIWLGFSGYLTTGEIHKKKVKLMSGNLKLNKQTYNSYNRCKHTSVPNSYTCQS
jgi:hypothetical protein